ncbi:DNA-binding response regulator [Paenibacillus glucanolyticus]|uniref:DNA-binding response regulator n=1 Tax=Paenibacillus glucanolyticus TaxID=59843 RepID=A0A163JJP1_9BACL|nr:response regulator [Paenibacillus glucanolyticus]KZS46627.1 DNA-binding response regulator [Paenibacillus glucanolyticus]
MRILIVDDEPLVRIGIKSAIDWEAQGVDIVGEAGDGEEALRMITETVPDVVLLDIKMPKMDGIEVLRAMKERQLPVQAVVLSSFDDITYVKEALKLGAFDYFHKPDMNERELTAMLKSIREQFGSQQAPARTGANAPGSRKEQILYDALHGNVHDLSAETGLKEGNMYVVLFKIKDYQAVIKRYTKETESILPNTVQNVVGEILSTEKEVEFLRLNEQLYAVFISNSELKSLLASLTRVNKMVQMISSALKRFVNIDIVLGISDWFADFDGISMGYEQAGRALSQQFYHPETSIFYYQHLRQKSESVYQQADVYLSQMKSALREEANDRFLELLSTWEKFLEQEECMEEKDVRKVYEGLKFMIGESGGKPSGAVQEEVAGLEGIHDFQQLSAAYRTLFEARFKHRHDLGFKGYSQLTRNIMEYTEEHYAESLSLKLFGELFHVSPNYVSRLFKQEVGQGLFDYINELRIEKAKVLLKNYRYKIYDVAEMVGFNNQAHFAIVFQKYTGFSPKQYRKEEV